VATGTKLTVQIWIDRLCIRSHPLRDGIHDKGQDLEISRLAECPNPNNKGRGPQPHEATEQTMTPGGYLLRVRRPEKPGDSSKDHDEYRVAQDS
jgi:hypothetical protein